jgi:hypothetical protein
MDTPFGHPWEKLGGDELRAFFADAPKDEGITWEAKSDDDRGALPRAKFREAIAAMANGFYVGYVVVGAAWKDPDGPWALVGLRQPPGIELTAWLDQLVDGVKPRPHVEIRRLEGDVGPAAVVQVLPLPVPPAITGGRLMVRTSGRTIALDDPGEIRRVVERGKQALDRARTDSVLAANVSRGIPFSSPFSPSVSIGVASTGRPDDVASRIFRASFVEKLRQSFVPWETRGIRRNLRSQMQPDRVVFWVEADSGSQAGALTSGAAFVTYWAGPDRDKGLDEAIDGLLARIWTFAGSIVSDLGGHGPSFAFVQANYPRGLAELARSTDEPVPSPGEVDECARHLARLRGDQDVFEPE